MPDIGAWAHSPCSKPLALAMDCRIWTQLQARLAQICNQQFPKGLEPRPVLTLISRQVKLNRNVSDDFWFGVIKGQRFPFRGASSTPFVFCCVTEPLWGLLSPSVSLSAKIPMCSLQFRRVECHAATFIVSCVILSMPAWQCPQTCPVCSCLILLLAGREPVVFNTCRDVALCLRWNPPWSQWISCMAVAGWLLATDCQSRCSKTQ